MRIGIDLMGGDTPPYVLFEAVLQAALLLDHSHSLVVIATKSVIDKLPLPSSTKIQKKTEAQIEFRAVRETIAMGDEPMQAFRSKKRSSLVVGVRLIKKKWLDAFVSCGNTGALVAGVTLSLPKLPGVQRIALLASIPSVRGSVAVLDVGGRVSCKAHHLVQFAHLGAAYQRAACGIETPSVGLLNIGIESRKGTDAVCQAYEELTRQSSDWASCGSPPPMHFVGNVEGVDVFNGKVDVVVTDGFTGNVLLKTTEGAAAFILDVFQNRLKEDPSEVLRQSFKALQKQFDCDEYPGAVVCGVDGVVIKSHGRSSVKAFLSSILGAAGLVKRGVIPLIKEQL